MCDTLVALPDATAEGVTLFAKNSDRHPLEAQAVEIVDAAEHAPGSAVRCTYLTIPQARRTRRALLSRPFWMWGAEMGVNEDGVAIGNEAIFTREPHTRGPALTGMDLVRLGLERASSAEEALEVIVALLEKHGQGGDCGYRGELRYHNSFLIADRRDAWVLETAGRWWVAERVRGVRSLSNAPTVAGAGERRADGLEAHARRRWGAGSLDFASDAADRLYTTFAAGRARCARSMGYLRAREGELREEMLMGLLRSHAAEPYEPARGWLGADVCMHAGVGPVRVAHTTGSLVVRLGEEITAWVTGTSTPCTSIFVPVWLDRSVPEPMRRAPGAEPDDSWWWRHQPLAVSVQRDHATRLGVYAAERDALEQAFLRDARAGERDVESFAARADEARTLWRARVAETPPARRPRLFDLAWRLRLPGVRGG